MNRPYYDQIGIEPSYTNTHLYEQIYDDRQLQEDGEDTGSVGTWENLKAQLEPEVKSE